MKTVFIDIDNTVAGLISHYLATYNKLYDAHFQTDCLTTYNDYDFASYTSVNKNDPEEYELQKERMIVIFNGRDFWNKLPVFNYAQEALEELNSEYDIYFLTSPSYKSTFFFSGRMEWINTHFPYMAEKTIFSKNKGLFKKNSLLIDDYPESLRKFRGLTIKMSYAYNLNVKANAVAFWNQWEKIPEIVRGLI